MSQKIPMSIETTVTADDLDAVDKQMLDTTRTTPRTYHMYVAGALHGLRYSAEEFIKHPGGEQFHNLVVAMVLYQHTKCNIDVDRSGAK